MKNEIEASKPQLFNHSTGEFLRDATPTELRASEEATESDGGCGIIIVDGVHCWAR